MTDQDKRIFMDAECPHCGEICGNGGCGDTFHCYYCGWTGKVGSHPGDIKALKEFMRRHKERNKEATP